MPASGRELGMQRTEWRSAPYPATSWVRRSDPARYLERDVIAVASWAVEGRALAASRFQGWCTF